MIMTMMYVLAGGRVHARVRVHPQTSGARTLQIDEKKFP